MPEKKVSGSDEQCVQCFASVASIPALQSSADSPLPPGTSGYGKRGLTEQGDNSHFAKATFSHSVGQGYGVALKSISHRENKRTNQPLKIVLEHSKLRTTVKHGFIVVMSQEFAVRLLSWWRRGNTRRYGLK